MIDSFKDGFTLKQFVAFTLAANWAFDQHNNDQHNNLINTQHFYNLVKKNMKFKGDEDIFRGEEEAESDAPPKSIIKSIRNYFSHFIHSPLRSLTTVEARDLNDMARRLLVELNERNIKANDKDDIQQHIETYLDESTSLFTFEPKPILDHAQPEMAFMLALFLSKGQMAFLCGKIFFGTDARSKQKDGTYKDTPKTCLQKKLLNMMAQPDNIIRRLQSDDTLDPWLESKHEQGFAIWQLLASSQKETAGGNEPDYLKNGNYMIRQLVRFIELHNVLPSYEFARIETVETLSDDVKKLEQKIQFSSNPDLPLATRHNTIQSVNQQGIKGTFGVRTLIYIVVVFLEQKRAGELANFVTTWLKANAHYPKTNLKGKDRPLSDQIAKRLDYLLKETNVKSKTNAKKSLHMQIRFICQRINHVWSLKYERHLSVHEYGELEKMVRYYRKAELRGWLADHGLLDIQNIQLGRGGIKTLKKAIKAESIQQLYVDMLSDYHCWLQEQKDKLPKLNDAAQQSMAKAINVRNNRQSNNKPDFPIGLPEKVLRQKFFVVDGKSHARSLTTILKSIPTPVTFNEPQGTKSKALKKSMQIRNYQQLLLAMAWHAVKDLISDERIKQEKNSETLPDLAEIPISINCENVRISMKFKKSWRNMATLNKGYIGKLMKQYCAGEKTIPMFRADETKAGKSVETTMQTFHSERYRFMQALMQWEKEFYNANPALAESSDEIYLKFECLAEKANLADGIVSMRGDAFHDGVPNARFADCPEPTIKTIYDQICEREKDKQKTQRQQGVKRNLAAKKNADKS
jgi:hypothetical protein